MNDMIKNGFVQYLGLASSDSKLTGNDAMQKGIADLSEICLEIALNKETNEYNLYILKPFIKPQK